MQIISLNLALRLQDVIVHNSQNWFFHVYELILICVMCFKYILCIVLIGMCRVIQETQSGKKLVKLGTWRTLALPVFFIKNIENILFPCA